MNGSEFSRGFGLRANDRAWAILQILVDATQGKYSKDDIRRANNRVLKRRSVRAAQ
jgi:hypothetical protein